MRSLWRTTGRETRSAVTLLCAAVGTVGISYGATAAGAGLPLWLPLTLSLLVLAAGSEFLFLGILAAGGSPLAALAAGLLVNARHLSYGLSIPHVVAGRAQRRTDATPGPVATTGQPETHGTEWRFRMMAWLRTASRAHLLNDETAALALTQPTPAAGRAAYLLCGLGILLTWPAGTLLGTALGALAPDPNTLGLDAVFPAVLLALVLPSLRRPAVRRAVLAGSATALLATPFLPSGLPVLLAATTTIAWSRRGRDR
ncbi:AzlC family ABC transporter permease [Nocardia carnea]|uniref:AzlC family ABC transporter permease n=1 Tax=Nocardia carnea TaxID=37328 RepID=UPI002453BC2C|nr:AzlC family ABC transporter permease [Nocardia carnea]